MDKNKLSSIKKIAEHAKEDINILKLAYNFATDEKFNLNISSNVSIVGFITIEYVTWVYYTFNETEYHDFIIKVKNKEIEIGNPIFGDFNPMNENVSQQSIELLDRLDYELNYLGKNFDIPLPTKFKPKYQDQRNSVRNEIYNIKELIKELELFILRVEMLIDNIVKFDLNDDEKSIEIFKSEWIKMLTNNKHHELLNELIRFYELSNDKNKVFKLILLSQRYNKINNEQQLGIKETEKIDIRLDML